MRYPATAMPLSALLIIFTQLFMSQAALADTKKIELTLNFQIITQLSIPKGSYHLTTWISKDDIRKTVLPEINRIWKPANIEFVEGMILTRPALNPADRKQMTDYIANATRDENGKADPDRIQYLSELIDFTEETSRSLNVYFVPYLGETSQGHAQRKLKRAFIGQWTDKASRGESKPERFKLVEHGAFKDGSIARTVAHEIGHLLKLQHPDKHEQTVFNRLMGGKNPGYTLTAEEIKRARKQAKKIN